MKNCIYCNSTNIQSGVEVGQSAEVGTLGLKYHTKFLVLGVEAFYPKYVKIVAVSLVYILKMLIETGA